MEKAIHQLKAPLGRFLVAIENLMHSGFSAAVRRLSWDTQTMEAYELGQLKKIVSFAYTNSLFYKELYDSAGVSPASLQRLADIEKFPILTKAMLRTAIAQGTIFTEPVAPKGSIREATTGSTGNPLVLTLDIHAHHTRALNARRAMFLMGAFPHKRFAFLWRKKALSIGQKIRSRLGLFKLIAVTDVMHARESALGTEDIAAIVRTLTSFRPQIIRGYTSAIWVVAQYAKRHNIAIRPEAVITSAEYLPPTWQKEMEQIFQCRVHNLYGGTEAAPVAVSLSNSGELIVFNDFYYTEVVNDQGERTAPGIPGRIVVTDYASRYLPLIRYEIGDVAEWSSTVAKPLPFFKEVRGRINDIFVLPGGRIIFSHNWHIYFRDLTCIAKFKVVQRTMDTIDILLERLTPDVAWNEELETTKRTVEQALGSDVVISWTLVDHFDLDAGDKFRATKSEVDVDTILKHL